MCAFFFLPGFIILTLLTEVSDLTSAYEYKQWTKIYPALTLSQWPGTDADDASIWVGNEGSATSSLFCRPCINLSQGQIQIIASS